MSQHISSTTTFLFLATEGLTRWPHQGGLLCNAHRVQHLGAQSIHPFLLHKLGLWCWNTLQQTEPGNGDNALHGISKLESSRHHLRAWVPYHLYRIIEASCLIVWGRGFATHALALCQPSTFWNTAGIVPKSGQDFCCSMYSKFSKEEWRQSLQVVQTNSVICWQDFGPKRIHVLCLRNWKVLILHKAHSENYDWGAIHFHVHHPPWAWQKKSGQNHLVTQDTSNMYVVK